MPVPTPTTFFSYARSDAEFVLRLAKDLRVAGAKIWLDQLDIGAGQLWDRAVEEALHASPQQVAVLSPEAVNSQNVMDEVSYALEERKQVIPVLYRDCQIPFRLRRVQYIDFRNDYERGLHDLLRALGVAEKGASEAGVWEASKGQPKSDLRKSSKVEVRQGQLSRAAELLPKTYRETLERSSIGSGIRASLKKRWIVGAIVVLLAVTAGIWYMIANRSPDESHIVSEIKHNISQDIRIAEKDIDVRFTKGMVELSGKVSSDAARSAAADDANVYGVNVVVNNLQVEARPTAPVPKATARARIPIPPEATPVIPRVRVPGGRRVYIMNAHSDLCLSPAGGNGDLNNSIVQYLCDSDPSRFWSFTDMNDGIVQIKNLSNGLCLSPAGGDGGLNNSIVQYTCDTDPSRRWRYAPIDAATFRLVNVHTNLCLTIAGGGTDRNTGAVQYRCDGDPSRDWKLRVGDE